jgi:hypothetical protein
MRLEDRDNFLGRRHLLAGDHTAFGLTGDLLGQIAVMVQFCGNRENTEIDALPLESVDG